MALSVLSTHTVRDNPVAKPSSQPTLAFDKLQQEVLTAHMRSEDPLVVAASLVSLRRILSSHLSAFSVHKSGVLSSLGLVASSYDAGGDSSVSLPIRRDALRCLALILASPSHRVDSLSTQEVARALTQTLSDPDPLMRELSAAALVAAAAGFDACRALTSLGFLAALVSQLRAETASGRDGGAEAAGSAGAAGAQLQALVAVLSQPSNGAAIAACLAAGAEDCLAQTLTAAMPGEGASAHRERLSLGLRAVGALALDPRGREACAAHPSLLPTIVSLAPPPPAGGASSSVEQQAGVSRQALGCLMALSTSDRAKSRIAGEAAGGGLRVLVAALNEARDPTTVVFAARTVAGLCPFPPARAGLLAAAADKAARGAAGRFPSDAAVGRACAAAEAAVTWTA